MSADNVTVEDFGPVGQTPEQILGDQVNLIASTTITGVAFGVVLTLYCICLYYLVHDLKTERRRNAIIGISYTTVMFLFGGLYTASNARTTQEAYVDNKNFPGGPNAYAMSIFDEPITIAGLVAFFAANWMTDAILIWRLSILFRGSRALFPILIIPVLLYLASMSMSLVTIIQATMPDSSFWSETAVPFTLAYYSLTVAMTVYATLAMIIRILLVRRQYQRVLGSSQHTAQYLGIVAMLIESSALYTVWACIFLALYIHASPIQYVFLGSLAEVQIISPLLIIFRVAQGKAWNSTTQAALTSTAQKGSRVGLSTGTIIASKTHYTTDDSGEKVGYELNPVQHRV